MARALVLALLGCTLAAAPALALADTVRLKNGQVIEGKVEDRGAYVIIHKKLGDVRIERAEILSIDVQGGAAGRTKDLDVVILLSGDEIEGRVRLDDEGRKVVLVRDVGGHENAIEFDQRQVRTILWSKGSGETPGAGGIAATVEKLREGLRAPEQATRDAAREQLMNLGIFALPYLEQRAPDPDPAVEQTLRAVVDAARVKSYLTPDLVERVPNLARRLTDAEPRERVQALKEAAVAAPRDCPALFEHVARRDPNKDVRAFVLGQLTLENRSQELIALLQAPDGSLRLAAAIALGDNGVYVGVPIVLEALKLEDAAVRKIAIAKLEAWTGQFLGYFADDPPEKRAPAVARWEQWWAANGKKFVDDSLRATIRRDEVTDDEKQLGLAEWTRAQKAWDAVEAANPPLKGDERKSELEKVRFLLQKALDLYPHGVNARLALGILLYTELGDPASAKRELEIVIGRYDEEGGALTKVLGHYHLARIAHEGKRWIEADRHYRQARALDEKNWEVLGALGRLAYERGLGDESLALPERKEALEDAVKFLGEAVAAVDSHEIEVRESAQAADAVELATPFKRGAFLKTIDQQKEALTRAAAELRYQRGRAYAALRRDGEAYADYAAASQLAPDNEVYKGAAAAWKPRAEAPQPAPKKPEGPTFRPEDVPR